MTSKVDFVKYNEIFLEKSWAWLNNPVIKSLTNTPDFTKETQLAWFQSLESKKDYFIRGINYNGYPVGVVGLKNITEIDAEYWGYIGEPDFWNKGIGSEMINFAIKNAKEKQLKKIYLKVLENNIKALNLYSKFNFKQIEIKENLIYMELDIK